MSCVSCSGDLWPGEEELCPSCAVAVRLEFRRGFRELEEYLARWADFATWLEGAPRSSG